jgi:hypothetical protein
MDQTTKCIPRVATLDGFADEMMAGDGIHLRDLEPMDVLLVRTRNSVYRMIITRDTEVTVQGGDFFASPTAAFVDGSGFGGSLIRIGWIGIGLRMEIRVADRRIVTSPVHSIARHAPPPRLH